MSFISRKSFKSALLAGTAAVIAATSFSTVSFAQQAEAVEKVTVTGSRIKRKNLTSVSPVQTLTSEEAKKSGTVGVEQLLNNQPIVFPGQVAEVANGATGTATVDLRGLGAARTLVLINGRRMGPGDPLSPVADLNSIPVALIDRVEVVSGGASAVYGSDALAGVVNFIMKKDFEGVQIDVQHGFAQHSNNDKAARAKIAAAGFKQAPDEVIDARTFTATATVGANTGDDKGNVTLYASFTNLAELRQDQRDFSACSYLDTGASLICLGSSNLNRISPALGTNAGNRYWITGSNDGIVANNTVSNWFLQPPATRAFNFAPDNFLQRPRDSYQFGGFAHYEVNKHFDFYVEAMLTNDHTDAQIAPSGAFATAITTMNCDNPLMSAAQRATLCAGLPANAIQSIALGRRNIEGGPRVADLQHTNYRVVVGSKGVIDDGWDYDVSAQYSKSPYQQVYRNEWSKQRLANALNVNPLDPTQCVSDTANCVPLDIFSGLGALSPAALAYVSATGIINGWVDEQIVTGSVTGDLATLGLTVPAAERGVQFAGGLEYRRQAIEFDASRDFQIDDLSGQGGNTPSQPERYFDVYEAFAEVEVPLIENMEFFKLLSLNGGYRVSDYSEAGIAQSYKYGLEWAPSEDIRFRASKNKATRAPSVLELFSPNSTGLFGGQDPCSGAVPTATLAQCIAMGLTTPAQQALYAGGLIPDCVSGQCSGIFGGNPLVKPEDSETITYGIVLTPSFLKGFSASIDWFDITVDDRIGTLGGQNVINQCLAGNAAFCALVTRDPLFGSIGFTGFGVKDVNVNAGSLSTSGIDIEVNYTVDLDDVGRLALSYAATLLDTYSVANLGAPEYDCAGFFGVVCGTPNFEYKSKARATWTTPWDVDLSVAWRHQSAVSLDANTTNPSWNCSGLPCGMAVGTIDDFDYFDLSGSWAVTENYMLRFGVNNVADTNPPVVDSNSIGVSSPPFGNANTYPGVYDSLGREFFIAGTAKF